MAGKTAAKPATQRKSLRRVLMIVVAEPVQRTGLVGSDGRTQSRAAVTEWTRLRVAAAL
jgi:hypothetical protein